METNYMGAIKLEEIDVNSIEVADYQRRISKSRVLKIVKNFDIHRMRPIEVNFRNGIYYCFDGQHRLTAYRTMGLEKIPAIIHYGCDYVREAMLFANQGDNVCTVNNKDRWNAARAAGQVEATRICKICGDYGYKVLEKHCDPAHNIQCIASLQHLVKEQGEAGLVWVMRMISRCWDGLPHAVSRDVVAGLSSIRKIYGNTIEEPRLEVILKKVTPDVLIRDAGKYRQHNYRGGDVRRSGIPVAKTIVGMYNRGLGTTSKRRLIDVYQNW